MFGTPGVTGKNVTVMRTDDGGAAWRPWYTGQYVSQDSGYPFTAVRTNATELHDLGSACASVAGAPQTIFNSSAVDTWGVRDGSGIHGRRTAAVSLESLPVPLTCSQGGVTADCFWLHAGGTAAIDGGTLLTSAVPWLNGQFGAPAGGAGIFAWRSTDGLRWAYHGTVATASMFPSSGEGPWHSIAWHGMAWHITLCYALLGEGPNEHDVVLLADGKTLLVVFRIDDGVDGGATSAKNYQQATSIDGGHSWTAPTEMRDASGRGMGVCRPRLLMLGEGGGPLLLSGGRLYTEQTRDILLWVSWDGMGDSWETYSISYQHNRLVQPTTFRFSAAVNSTQGRATTSYTSLLRAADPHSAVLAYNGESGVFSMRITAPQAQAATLSSHTEVVGGAP
jgi:hypothetical protein